MRWIAVMIGAAGCGWRCEQERLDFEDELAAANYCEVDEDCGTVTACPHGCNIPVNKGEEDGLQERAEEIDRVCGQACQYDCVALTALYCEEGACVAEMDTTAQ